MTERTAKFGWCLTNQHEACSKQFGEVKCACSCHTEKPAKKKSSKKKSKSSK